MVLEMLVEMHNIRRARRHQPVLRVRMLTWNVMRLRSRVIGKISSMASDAAEAKNYTQSHVPDGVCSTDP